MCLFKVSPCRGRHKSGGLIVYFQAFCGIWQLFLKRPFLPFRIASGSGPRFVRGSFSLCLFVLAHTCFLSFPSLPSLRAFFSLHPRSGLSLPLKPFYLLLPPFPSHRDRYQCLLAALEANLFESRNEFLFPRTLKQCYLRRLSCHFLE